MGLRIWRAVGVAMVIAGVAIAWVSSRTARRELLEALDLPSPHETEALWAGRFDEERALAQFEGEWEPKAPDESGCTWSIHRDRLTQTCAEPSVEKRIRLGPGFFLIQERDGASWKKYGWAKLGDQLYVGPAVTGLVMGDLVVVDDAQNRIVADGDRCVSYRKVMSLGGGPDWEHEPRSIACGLEPDRFRYQTVGFAFRLDGQGDFSWIDTEVKRRGDALYTKNIEDWPLVRKGVR